MERRKSERLAAKEAARPKADGQPKKHKTKGKLTEKSRRVSVGAALGMTPGRFEGENLVVGKAAAAAKAAALRLDALNASSITTRRRTK